MWSSSLRRRTLATGVLVVALVLGGLDIFLYYSMKVELRDNVDLLLQERAGLARSLGADLPPDQLAARLQAAGVRASIASAGSGTRLSAPFSDESGDVRTRRKVPDGSSSTRSSTCLTAARSPSTPPSARRSGRSSASGSCCLRARSSG